MAININHANNIIDTTDPLIGVTIQIANNTIVSNALSTGINGYGTRHVVDSAGLGANTQASFGTDGDIQYEY